MKTITLKSVSLGLFALLISSCVTKEQIIEGESSFQKTLNFDKYSFEVISYGNGSVRELTIEPKGFEASNRKETQEIYGEVAGAETADLNQDGFPEVLVFVRSAGSGSYGNVIAYSSNNGKSMSLVTFPETSENKEISEGYMGHDEFFVEENQLVQKFPIYKPEDANSNPSGGARIVKYKMLDGENSRFFVVESVKDEL